MKRRKTWILVLVCLALVLGPTALFARRRIARRTQPTTPVTITWPAPAPTASTPPPAPPFKIDPEQAMTDILRLRNSEGFGSDEAGDAAFENALREIIAKEHGVEPATVQTELPAQNIASPVEALRHSAKHFDDRAAELEAAKDYAAADSARATAAELRREARRLDP